MPLPPNQIPRPVADVAIAFIRTRTDLGRAEGRWQDAPKLGRAFPLFRPDMERPAYFEVELVSAGQKAGSLVVSVLEDDFPVPSFTTAGGTAAERLRADVSSRLPAGTAPFQVIRIVRYGTGFIAAEEGQGKHLGHLGEMPCLVLGTSAPEGGYDSETREGEGTDASMEALEYESYDELRDAFAADFAPWLAERAAEAKADWDLLRRPAQPGAGGGGSSYTDCWAGSWSEQRKHSQIPQGTSPNTSSCPSGFCATAWTMLYSWLDHERNKASLIPGGGAPECDSDDTDDVQWKLRQSYLDTFCLLGGGGTYPWKVDNGVEYAEDKGRSVGYGWKWCAATCSGTREKASEGICNWETPAIIGFDYMTFGDV